jgi:hypothetical protein
MINIKYYNCPYCTASNEVGRLSCRICKKDMNMNISDERFDELETVYGETCNGFKHDRLIEAVGNDEDERIASCVYRIAFAPAGSDLSKLKDELIDALDAYNPPIKKHLTKSYFLGIDDQLENLNVRAA